MLVCGPFNSIRLEFVYFFETRIANLRLSFCFWLNLGFYLNCEEKFFDEKKLDNPNGWRTTKIWWSMSRRLLKVSFIVFITAHLCVYVICILTNVAAAIFLATKKRILLNFLFILLNFRISYDILCIYFVAN